MSLSGCMDAYVFYAIDFRLINMNSQSSYKFIERLMIYGKCCANRKFTGKKYSRKNKTIFNYLNQKKVRRSKVITLLMPEALRFEYFLIMKCCELNMGFAANKNDNLCSKLANKKQ